jgi:uracil-DNA glycosylase family 4
VSDRSHRFESLICQVRSCTQCPRMGDSVRVLSWANGPVTAPLMFVGEAPGRMGADRTAVPFHGDKAGDNFEALLDLAGLRRANVFVTNAVLCNPRDADGNNAPPSTQEIDRCARHLRAQIEVVQPKMVMTLGAVALEATRLVESHALSLKGSVRTANNWFGRLLLPLYHPGARAMVHRSFANQTADYYFVGETFRRLQKRTTRKSIVVRGSASDWNFVRYILERSGPISPFRLHKLVYLSDVASLERTGIRATSFFYLRQKDGPYCVELGSRWYRRFEPMLRVRRDETGLTLEWQAAGLFDLCTPSAIDAQLAKIVDEVVSSTVRASDSQLKTRAYLTRPMKRVLRAEKAGQTMLNTPLLPAAA